MALLGVVIAAVLMVPVASAGQVSGKNATLQQYDVPAGGLTGSSQGTAGANGAAGLAGSQAVRGTLPFTGAQLTIFALLGAGLLVSGLVLRSTAREKSRS
jgi:hypothetical protein